MAIKKGTHLADTLNGTSGRDFLFGDLGADTLNGLDGDDRLFGGDSNDRLEGGAGDDNLVGGLGADTLNGGDGNDHIEHAAGFNVFSSEDSSIDIINAGAGDDIVSFGITDTALGGSGSDLLQLEFSPGFGAAAVNYKLDFSVISGSTAKAIGAAGTSFASTKAGQFEAVSFFALDAKAGSSVTGTNGDDTLWLGVDFNETGARGITLKGLGGNDQLTGSDRNDTLNGGSGDDIINGGMGDNTMTGGTGADIFVFELGDFLPTSDDTITDFDPAEELLAFVTSPLTALDFGSQSNLLLKGSNPTSANTAAGIAQFLYSTSTGVLSLDSNGNQAGGVQELMTLANKPAGLTAANLLVEFEDFLF